jgi:hypothetical protein
VERAPAGAAAGISASTVSRIWREHKLKPHQVRSFKFSKDPQLVKKVIDVVGLYLAPPKGALVICVDEKTPTQWPEFRRSGAHEILKSPGNTGDGGLCALVRRVSTGPDGLGELLWGHA